jgi:N-methylhydantoinase A
VVLVNARVAVVGLLPSLRAEQTGAGGSGRAAQTKSRRVYMGRWLEVPVYDLESVRSGLEVKGPAIFESSTTTVVLRENERATVTPLGWLDIRLS